MSSLYRRWILKWETALSRRDPHRRVTPFEWGWEWLRATPVNGLPAAIADRDGMAVLRAWNDRVVAASERFFAYEAVRDYCLRGDRLLFTSPVPSRHPENEQVTARWYPAPGKRAVVVLPQWNADGAGHLGLCQLFQRFGIASLRLSLPYHDVRMPAELKRAEYTVDPNLGRTIAAARQAVIDVRACVDWLESRGYSSLGIVGTSLGSCYALLTTAHEPRLRVNVFNHVSPWFGDVVWTGISTRHVRQGLEAAALDRENVREAWRVISPFSYLDRLVGSNKKHLLVYARHDPSFLPELSRIALERFRELGVDHTVRVLPCGHYTTGQFPFNYLDAFYMTHFLRRWL